ncbi:hypothetical protein EH165_00560 [Nakamurella antarctica]|uniref:Uncharacterized protein n=1 Tax=Nakamurella antarctica TaxID=1902245 RepID=A0A3G8ZHX8_9ACTN|nr:hypothetical protein [Nakamurella antarctica]AZI56883.1 hypothetical protein EH165_00560 [Nakamurella antarctica]
MSEKRRYSVGRGLPLTAVQWTIFGGALLVAVVGMTGLIVLGRLVLAAGVGGLAALTMAGVQLAGIGARNDRIVRGDR